jgi:ribosomal protein S18 acetylase RimI-like enzyme
MHIRELGPSDAQEFQALRLQGLIECPLAFVSSYEEERNTPLSVLSEQLLAKPGRCVLGVFLDSLLVGIVGLQREEMKKLSHKAFIWGMYVAPVARRRGVGRELVATALAHASRMQGVRQVNLGVNAVNAPAIRLYESLGFTSFGVERGFMLLGGELHDEVHMGCLLPAT